MQTRVSLWRCKGLGLTALPAGPTAMYSGLRCNTVGRIYTRIAGQCFTCISRSLTAFDLVLLTFSYAGWRLRCATPCVDYIPFAGFVVPLRRAAPVLRMPRAIYLIFFPACLSYYILSGNMDLYTFFILHFV